LAPRNDSRPHTAPDPEPAGRTSRLQGLGRIALQARPSAGPGGSGRLRAILPAVGRPVEKPPPKRASFAWDWFDGLPRLSQSEQTRAKQTRPTDRPPEREEGSFRAGKARGWDFMDRPARSGGEEGRAVNRPERIIAAATAEFAARGFFGARLERIAAQAACNKALIHYYHKDKAGLYAAALDRALASLLDHLGQVPTTGQKPRNILIQVVRASLDFCHHQNRSALIIIRDLVDGGQGLATALAASGQGGEDGGGQARLKGIADGLTPALAPGLDPVRLLIWVLALSLTSALGGSAKAASSEERLVADQRQILTLLESGVFTSPA